MWWLTALALAQSMEITGTCPGTVELTLSELAPAGRWAVLSSEGPGAAALPGGPCAGTLTDLDPRRLALRQRGDSGSGTVVLGVDLMPAACELHLQLVDLAECTLAPVVTLERPAELDGTLRVGVLDWVIRREGIDGTGPIEVRCGAWDGDVCADLQVRTPADGCDLYAAAGSFHPVVAANRPEDRACPLLCAATTAGVDETATVCESGDGSVGGDRRACSWASPEATCAEDDWHWRTDVSTLGDPWIVNVRLGDCYPDSAPLRLSCAGWIR
ncbi:MAG: hypothetical protein ACI8PZ_002965 [Myxococcota bacterium]|jgi:hypothetical protein